MNEGDFKDYQGLEKDSKTEFKSFQDVYEPCS